MNKTNFGLGILVAIIGLLVMINPESSIKVIVILLGVGAIADGLYSIIKMRKLLIDTFYTNSILIRGIVSIIVGILAVAMPVAFFNAAENIIHVMLYVVAVYLILSAAGEIMAMVKLSQAGMHDQVKGLFWTAIGSLVIAVLLFMLPRDYGQTVVRVIGALIMVGGVGYTIWTITHPVLVVEAENVRDESAEEAAAEETSNSEDIDGADK